MGLLVDKMYTTLKNQHMMNVLNALQARMQNTLVASHNHTCQSCDMYLQA